MQANRSLTSNEAGHSAQSGV